MSENKKYYWFKMQEDFFASKEMKKLRKIAGGDTFTIIYLKMIMLSIETEGKIFFDGVEDLFADEIALSIDENAENVNLTMSFLIKNKLVDVMSDSEIVINEAVKSIGKETDSAERVRLHRERKKQILLQCNSDVTKCNTEIEIDKDIEININKEIKKDYSVSYEPDKKNESSPKKKKQPNEHDIWRTDIEEYKKVLRESSNMIVQTESMKHNFEALYSNCDLIESIKKSVVKYWILESTWLSFKKKIHINQDPIPKFRDFIWSGLEYNLVKK